MDPAALAQPRRDILEHQAHAGVERTQHPHLVAGHETGVGMRQQSLRKTRFRRARDILDRAPYAECRQRCAIFLEGQLGLVPETEQRLLAAELGAAPRPGRDFVERHGPRAGVTGVLAKGAIGAAIAAEIGDRQEDLARIADLAPLSRDRATWPPPPSPRANPPVVHSISAIASCSSRRAPASARSRISRIGGSRREGLTASSGIATTAGYR